MPANPRQSNLFDQSPLTGNANHQEELSLNPRQLRDWQERIHRFQAPLFQAGSAVHQQGSLFSNSDASLADFQPLARESPSRSCSLLGHGSPRRAE